jgi:hypothetical protein
MAKKTDGAATPKRRGRQPLPTVIDPETGEEVKVRAERHPIPDGWLLAPDFHIWITHFELSNASIQTVYGWLRGTSDHTVTNKKGEVKVIPSNGFPCVEHSDGRIIIDREKAIHWIKLHEEAKTQRELQKTQRVVNNSTRLVSSAVQLNVVLARQAANMRVAA